MNPVGTCSTGRPPTYPVKVMEFARRLHATGNYSISAIRFALEKQGYTPAHSTVVSWVNPDRAEGRRMSQRNGRPRGPAPKLIASELRLRRMRELRELGVACASTAILMRHEFGIEITSHQVSEIMKGRMRPENVRKLMSGQPLRRGVLPGGGNA